MFTLVSWSDVFIFTIFADFFLFKITIRLGSVHYSSSFHIVSTHSRHLFLLVLLFLQILLRILIVKSYRLVTPIYCVI